MKKLKRIAAVLLACALALTMLVGCGGGSSNASSLTLNGLNDAVNQALSERGHDSVTEKADETKLLEQYVRLEPQLQFTYNLTGEAKAKAEAANNELWETLNAIFDSLADKNGVQGGYENWAAYRGDESAQGWWFFVESPQSVLAQDIAEDIINFEEYAAEKGRTFKVTGIAYAIEEDMPLDVDRTNQTVTALNVWYFYEIVE